MPTDATTPTEPINQTPAAANAAPASTPAVPPAPPVAAEPPTSEDNNVLNTILGLIKPEDKKVAPPTEVKKEPAAPTEKTAEKSVEPAQQKTVKFKKREATAPAMTEDKVAETVRRVLEESKPAPAPVVQRQEPVAPAAPEFPSDISPEERDELDLYKFIETKDPSKKGLLQKGVKFLEENKKFLERRMQEEGDDYDPATDPQYKKFLDTNEPKLTQFEKRRFTIQRETEGLKQEAYEQAKRELHPQIEAANRKIREIEENPKINNRLASYRAEVADVMPEEVVKVWRENNNDFNKVREQFPIEFEAISSSAAGAIKVAEEFLKIRSGVAEFQQENPQHQYMQQFIDDQAKVFAEKGGNSRIRDGKQFVHPYQFKAGMEGRYWTFDNEDVLAMLKYQAGREAKARIANEYSRIELASEARKRRLAAQNGAVSASAQAQEPVSPTIPSSPSPGASVPVAVEEKNILNSILGFGTK